MNELIFIHGRAQEHRDPLQVKSEWTLALQSGLASAGLSLPIPEEDIRLAYYGQTLFDLSKDIDGDAAEVIVRGSEPDEEWQSFFGSVVTETQKSLGISDSQVSDELQSNIQERGPMNWEWVQGILKAIDRSVPGASSKSIWLTTNDVYRYLHSHGIRDTVESGVRNAFKAGGRSVVVSHSLGTVVAYNLLRREGSAQHWQVPLFVTLGSPLAVSEVKKTLAPLQYPDCVDRWFNAFDDRDVVALYPLNKKHFPVEGDIENKDSVKNSTKNRHGISGYLSDPDVATAIHAALDA